MVFFDSLNPKFSCCQTGYLAKVKRLHTGFVVGALRQDVVCFGFANLFGDVFLTVNNQLSHTANINAF